ncbi:MAG TPA: DUF3237 domain-containing protein [Pseudomonadales bacterium]
MGDGTLTTRFLCEVRITLADEAPLDLGASPWRRRRVSDIGGGRFEGPRLAGRVRRSGADWSEGGVAADGGAATLIDVRSLWETDDGALIYVSYAGRLVIPKPLLARFRDPAQVESIPPEDYYFRILPVFETSAEHYAWLNEVVAVGVGRRTADGVVYRIHQVD